MTTQQERLGRESHADAPGAQLLAREDMDALFGALQARGYTPVGPTPRDGAIVLDVLEEPGDLPWAWGFTQEGSSYNLQRDPDAGAFDITNGPQSFKQYLYPPKVRLWQAEKRDGGFAVVEEDDAPPRYALIGVRACDLAALDILDRVFDRGDYPDPTYQARRREALTIAVNCGKASGTCFCVSMGTGPKATSGFDLALTEIVEPGRHRFLVEAGSARGCELLADLPLRPATDADLMAAEEILERTAASMGRHLETAGLQAGLQANLEHPHWDDVAKRCLTCANCTMVCPTCFCTTVEDQLDLEGNHAERWRQWDSCFTFDFTHTAGGALRQSGASRYRQWLTHKLSTWIDQFDTFGCVGCGRCITWCPVGIDITKEATAIMSTPGSRGDGP